MRKVMVAVAAEASWGKHAAVELSLVGGDGKRQIIVLLPALADRIGRSLRALLEGSATTPAAGAEAAALPQSARWRLSALPEQGMLLLTVAGSESPQATIPLDAAQATRLLQSLQKGLAAIDPAAGAG